MRKLRDAICAWVLVLPGASIQAQQLPSRFETFDRYDPTQYAVEVEGVPGEHIDMRTLGVNWEVTDYVIPGDGGLDIELTRSFNRLFHTPSDMGHWYFGVPRIQIPTSPWRGPYDPASPAIGTIPAAVNNLYARLGYGGASICDQAGHLVDAEFRGSLSDSTMGGILFAAPITLYVPGQGPQVLLEKRSGQTQFPAAARYVTTDNWWARCLPPAEGRIWGGFEVVSPDGYRYVFDFIQYLVPGDYATGSTGGWVEMGISRISDRHGNSLNYIYDLQAGGSQLLAAIEASDGRRVTLDYYEGSRLGVDVQGSPLALISAINIHADDQVYSIRYEYCDFADYYLLQTGCEPIELGVNMDLPVLHAVHLPDGLRTEYRYDPSVYSANVLLDWGNFEFQLKAVRLPTGGVIEYDYHPGYHAVLQRSDSPAPRLSRRRISGRDVQPAEWHYDYSYANHEETATVTGPDRQDIYTFYEGLGTYEFRIARYPGQHQWPGTVPTDYDEEMGLLRRLIVNRADGTGPLRETVYEYARQPLLGLQTYSGNWLGWPTLVLAQIRQRPTTEQRVIDHDTALQPVVYVTRTDPADYDVYGFPRVVEQTGVDPLAGDGLSLRRTDYTWVHDRDAWRIGLPDTVSVDGYTLNHDYVPGTGLLSRISDGHITTHYEYGPSGNRSAEVWQRDGVEYRRTFGNYHRGRYQTRTEPVDPSGGRFVTLRRAINDLGQERWHEDGAGNRTVTEYDFSGRLTRVVSPGTSAISISYPTDSAGHWIEVVYGQGAREMVATLDGFGRTTVLRDYADGVNGAVSRALTWDFDEAGRMIFRSLPFAWPSETDPEGIAYQYDALSRLVQEQFSGELNARTYCYSHRCNNGALSNGYVLTDERGVETVREFAALGDPDASVIARISEQVSLPGDVPPEFRTTRLQHDANGQLLSMAQGTDGGAELVRTFGYEGRQLVAEQHPETGLTEHRYDERGNRIYSRTGTATPVLREFDGLDRLVLLDYPGERDDVRFDYDDAGRLRSAENSASSRTYEYDPAGRLVREVVRIDEQELVIVQRFNAAGHKESVVYPSGMEIDFQPDGFGMATRAGSIVTGADYWPGGQLKSLIFGNSVTGHFGLDSRQFAATRRFEKPGGSVLVDLGFEYDASGNLRSVSDNHAPRRNVSLEYDGLSRLTSATGFWGNERYAFDMFDNLLERDDGALRMVLEYGSDNLPAEINLGGDVSAVEHDAKGNLLADGGYDYTFNAASQLTGIAQFADLQYRYDGHGRRIARDDTSGTEYSLYDRSGALMYVDRCQRGGGISEFVYIADELAGRVDSECAAGCHP